MAWGRPIIGAEDLEECRPVTTTERAAITTYLAGRLEVEPKEIGIVLTSAMQDGCFTRVTAIAPDIEQPLVMYLSPDHRFLAPALIDINRRHEALQQPSMEEVRMRLLGARRQHVRGDATAPVDLVVFIDFQCPYCKELDTMLAGLPERTTRLFRLTIIQYPLRGHDWAREASSYAVCAGLQNPTYYWTLHNLFFEKQVALTAKSLGSEALQAVPSLDVAALKKCVDAGEGETTLNEDRVLARDLGVIGTPTLIINGQRRVGIPTLRQLERWISSAAEQGHESISAP
jgi:protein-disulfide isomerase